MRIDELNDNIDDLDWCRAELKRKILTEETLVKCIHTFYEHNDMDVAIDNLLSLVAGFYKADRSYIFEFDDNAELMDNTYEWCKDGVEPEIQMLKGIEVSVIDRWMKEFEEKGSFYISSREEDGLDPESVEYALLKQQGIDSLLATPLKISGKYVGFLGVDNPMENTDLFVLLQSVAAFVINDIQRRRDMERLKSLSYTDRLTGVGNRHAYVRYMEMLEGKQCPLGIVFVDINGLKIANDRHGHEYGDWMIMQTTDIIGRNFNENIFRIGGDEFVILCPDIESDDFEKKVAALKASWTAEVTASVGSKWLEKCDKIEEQVADTDRLMYVDKKKYYSARDAKRN